MKEHYTKELYFIGQRLIINPAYTGWAKDDSPTPDSAVVVTKIGSSLEARGISGSWASGGIHLFGKPDLSLAPVDKISNEQLVGLLKGGETMK